MSRDAPESPLIAPTKLRREGGSSRRGAGGDAVVGTEALWALFGWVGLLFVVVAGADIALTWVPANFGNREWEFGTITASYNAMLSVTFGMAMMLGWLAGRESPASLKVLGAALALFGLVCLSWTVLYWRTVPLALSAVAEGPVRTGLLKAVVKTAFQGVAYPVALLLLAWTSLKWSIRIEAARGGEAD